MYINQNYTYTHVYIVCSHFHKDITYELNNCWFKLD